MPSRIPQLNNVKASFINLIMSIPSISQKPAFFLVLTILLLKHQHVTSLSEPNFVNNRCNDTSGNYSTNSAYKNSLDLVLKELGSKSSMNGSALIEEPEKVYGLFYCRGDIDKELCSSCVKAASMQILSACPVQKNAVVWYQECTLRYSANDSTSFLEDDGKWVGQFDHNNVSDPSQFLIKLTRAISPLINKTAYGGELPGYQTGEVNISKAQMLYCLVQCSPFSTGDHCDQCLNRALDEVNDCCFNGSTQLMVFNPNCQLRYDVLPFYNLQLISQKNATGLSPLVAITDHSHPAVFYVTRVAVPLALTLLLAGIGLRQRSKILKVIDSLKYRQVDRYKNHRGATNFSFREMKKATSNFSVVNELGRGGFGVVYRGLLEDGKEVAIKRLKERSQQGDEEFSMEVNCLAQLQHRNLVKLLGYCAEGKERMLVYELVQKSSFDKILFDAALVKNLDWKTRYRIIVGIARGLQYLHTESCLNVVHLDLKPSNILLDANMVPKIADFGLAKEIQLDHTRGDASKCVGTMGYMAPELPLYGEFSTKSDVYSFGVMLLEILSGKKNVISDPTSLLSNAWKFWREGKPEELVDHTLKNESKKVIRCIRIALACSQENPLARPTMQDVLIYLNKDSVDIPTPIVPPIYRYDTTTSTSIMVTTSRRNVTPLSEDETFRSCTDQSLPTKASEEEDLYPRF